LSVAEAIELQAFARHETLDPVGWEQTAHLIQTIMASGPRPADFKVPPIEDLTPTEPWPAPDAE
jgi:hypothetical protein